jgi:hypothetical protein
VEGTHWQPLARSPFRHQVALTVIYPVPTRSDTRQGVFGDHGSQRVLDMQIYGDGGGVDSGVRIGAPRPRNDRRVRELVRIVH